MKLDRSDILHGYPAKKIRDFLGHGRDGAFSYRDYCEVETFFGVADDYFGYDAKVVTAELLKRGWIIKGKGRDLKECTEDQNTAIMILTQIGKQSRIVSLNKRFSRAEGEAVVAELVERAKAINARDDLLCGISELRLYGSMLDPKVETVGDVDVAYELSTSSHHRGSAEANGTLKELSNLVGIFSFVKCSAMGPPRSSGC